jgi:hypothetical protein
MDSGKHINSQLVSMAYRIVYNALPGIVVNRNRTTESIFLAVQSSRLGSTVFLACSSPACANFPHTHIDVLHKCTGLKTAHRCWRVSSAFSLPVRQHTFSSSRVSYHEACLSSGYLKAPPINPAGDTLSLSFSMYIIHRDLQSFGNVYYLLTQNVLWSCMCTNTWLHTNLQIASRHFC